MRAETGWGGGVGAAVRAFYRADINCMVIINQLRGLAIWTCHGVIQTRIRALIGATAEGTTSRCGIGNNTNNLLPNPSGLLWETEDRACVFHRAQSAPPGCYSTKGSDITTETGGRGDGVKDEDWSGCGQCRSRITPLQLLSTCHRSTRRTQQ